MLAAIFLEPFNFFLIIIEIFADFYCKIILNFSPLPHAPRDSGPHDENDITVRVTNVHNKGTRFRKDAD